MCRFACSHWRCNRPQPPFRFRRARVLTALAYVVILVLTSLRTTVVLWPLDGLVMITEHTSGRKVHCSTVSSITIYIVTINIKGISSIWGKDFQPVAEFDLPSRRCNVNRFCFIVDWIQYDGIADNCSVRFFIRDWLPRNHCWVSGDCCDTYWTWRTCWNYMNVTNKLVRVLPTKSLGDDENMRVLTFSLNKAFLHV